ncbi:MAG: hypothetical protein LBQ02_03940, partial [Candidatus Nomurabacteria bacterium]|nr:hypothetical protein [Candidatus Nomurabacteria bacterium]
TANCPATTTIAYDERDNHHYAIQKLADGKCWMLTNLAYGGTEAGTKFTSGAGQSTATNVAASGTNWNRVSPPYNNQKQWLDPTTAAITLYSGTRCSVAYRTTFNSIDYTECGYFYNWCAALGAASASCNTSTNGAVIPNAGVNICPAGWRLPTGGSTGEFQAMYDAIGGTLENLAGTSSVWRGARGGYFTPGNGLAFTSGNYWSATPMSSTTAYFLGHGSVVNIGNFNKFYAISVRCVAAN